MARRSQGWTCELPQGRTVYVVRFRHAGRRFQRSTGETDPRKAQAEAKQIYAAIVSGRQAARSAVDADLEKAFAAWLADYEITHSPGTAETVTDYVRAHFVPFFGSFERFTLPSYGDYMRRRIKAVTRTTLRKELSALRMFVAWCTEQGVKGMADVPSLPKHGHAGTRAKNARRRVATILSPEKIARILMAMPERSRRTGVFVRPFFQVLWETALRPYSTVLNLETPLHYKAGASELFISREIDKARYERTIPITDAASEALTRVCPKSGSGKLFEIDIPENMEDSLEAAVRAAGIEETVSIYDFRHSRISYLANSGAPLAGVARLVGHKHISTTALYVQTSNEAALAALDAVAKEPRRRPRETNEESK